jgi:hypothetical protein
MDLCTFGEHPAKPAAPDATLTRPEKKLNSSIYKRLGSAASPGKPQILGRACENLVGAKCDAVHPQGDGAMVILKTEPTSARMECLR